MKALNFVIGMIVGMVLLVVAVAGAVLAAGTLVSVGQIESTLGTDIFDDESSVNDLTVLELVQNLVKDLQNLDGFTIEKLKTDYGVKIPDEISGIDITPVFGYPITEVPNHLGDIVNNMTLRDVGEFLDMDFETEYPDLRVLQDNLDEKVNVALDNVLSSIDDEKMTVYTIERDFGLSLGENNLITTLKHTPLSSFAAVMDHLPVGTVVDADSDLFVAEGAVALFVVTDEFVEVPAGELTSSLADEGSVAETYIAGADENGIIYREMRYVMNDDGTYEPDNSCYASSFDAAANTETYYRHIVYTAYDSAATYGEGTVFAVKTFLNDFVSDGAGGFVLADGGFFTLDNVFTDLDGTTLNAYIISDASVVKEGGLDLAALELYVSVTNDDDTTSLRPADTFGVDPAVTVDDDTRLDDNFTGWVRIHVGDADPAMQVIAGETISTISGATDAITALKLGEVLDIDESSAKILQTLADTPINKMSDALDTITLADATDIAMSEYVEAQDGDGAYVKVTSESGGTYYTLYNPSVHGTDVTRYDRTVNDGDASVALQRLAGTTIPNISAAFSEMVLGDALNIEVDTFAPVSEPQNGETYYVFNETLGYPERVVYEDGKSDPDAAYFERTSEGEGNAVLKQLAYVKIDNVSEAMDGIIENTLLSDIIDVVEYAVIEVTDVSSDPDASYEQWFFEHDAVYTVGTGEDAKHYTFVYDGNGKYYMTDVIYLPATKSQLTEKTTGYFIYQKANFSNLSALYEHLLSEPGNLFFSDGEVDYEANPALTAYYLASPDTALDKINGNAYIRVECDASAAGASEATIYDNVSSAQAQGGLYVKDEGSVTGSAESGFSVTFGGYTLYNAANPAHWGAELFFKYSDGFYPASSEVIENGGYTLYTYSREGGFTEASDPTGSDEEYYVKLAAKAEDGRTEADGNTLLNLYYFTLIDENFEESYTVYANRECDTVYVKDEGGDWVKVGSEWVAFDENDPEHEGLDRFNAVIGYIGNSAANDGGGELDRLSHTAVTNTIEEKSPTILITLLQRQVTIGSLNDTIDTLTIGELMEIEPGSVFDNDVLRNATIENLSEKVSSLFTDMTIGTLLEYANVSVSSEIAYILQDVKIADFFGALEYQNENGQLTVNMEKLFGIE